jgi:hypothetical protein
MKGLIGVVCGFLSLFPFIIFELLHVRRPGLVLGLGIPFLLAIVAYYFSRQAKNGGSKILGTVGVALGVVGMLIYIFNIFSVVSALLLLK